MKNNQSLEAIGSQTKLVWFDSAKIDAMVEAVKNFIKRKSHYLVVRRVMTQGVADFLSHEYCKKIDSYKDVIKRSYIKSNGAVYAILKCVGACVSDSLEHQDKVLRVGEALAVFDANIDAILSGSERIIDYNQISETRRKEQTATENVSAKKTVDFAQALESGDANDIEKAIAESVKQKEFLDKTREEVQKNAETLDEVKTNFENSVVEPGALGVNAVQNPAMQTQTTQYPNTQPQQGVQQPTQQQNVQPQAAQTQQGVQPQVGGQTQVQPQTQQGMQQPQAVQPQQVVQPSVQQSTPVQPQQGMQPNVQQNIQSQLQIQQGVQQNIQSQPQLQQVAQPQQQSTQPKSGGYNVNGLQQPQQQNVQQPTQQQSVQPQVGGYGVGVQQQVTQSQPQPQQGVQQNLQPQVVPTQQSTQQSVQPQVGGNNVNATQQSQAVAQQPTQSQVIAQPQVGGYNVSGMQQPTQPTQQPTQVGGQPQVGSYNVNGVQQPQQQNIQQAVQPQMSQQQAQPSVQQPTQQPQVQPQAGQTGYQNPTNPMGQN